MDGLFVTGTDTGVGKTIIGVALLQAAARRGLRVAAMKPIETGCRTFRGERQPEDARRLAGAAHAARGWDILCPYRLEAPLAPSVAARREGTVIDLARIEQARVALAEDAPDWLLVEGAGGLLVPINDEQTMADLALLFGYRLLIVARDRLGAINHTLLTIEAARRRAIPLAGVVLNADNESAVDHENAGEIARVGGVPIAGRFPWIARTTHLPKLDLGVIAERSLDLDALLPPRRV